MEQFNNIRNFCIIAHVDHGKSTLADRFLEITNTVPQKDMRNQLLDSNPIERERGITIKLAPVRMKYKDYILNLIDTPGHADFSYEVSRSLAACEGAVLVIDATQGIQAQTIAHANKALENNLVLIPVINKIDLPNADIEGAKKDLVETFGFNENEILMISAKLGTNVNILLEKIIEKIPCPKGELTPARALLFNSSFDAFKGVVAHVRVVDGEIKKNDFLKLIAQKTNFQALEVGFFSPKMIAAEKISTGEVGFIATGLKDASLCKVGDTITASKENPLPLPGYIEPKPFVFVGLYPIDGNEYFLLKESLEKLKLTDSSLYFEPESSLTLGHGFTVGFLGLLHAEITQERLQKEYNLDLIVTTPSVEYKIKLKDKSEVNVKNAAEFPDPALIEKSFEPITKSTIITPKEYLGSILTLCQNKRGELVSMEYRGNQTVLIYKIPLAELITDFYSQLKSLSQGYASLDYEIEGVQEVEIVKLSILINHDPVDALSQIIVKEKSESAGRILVEKLKEIIPRQQFEIAIQAAIGGKIIARSDVKAFRKDVTQKLYGGDRTRKDKLLEAQKKGKMRLKTFGEVQIPQKAFYALFSGEKA